VTVAAQCFVSVALSPKSITLSGPISVHEHRSADRFRTGSRRFRVVKQVLDRIALAFAVWTLQTTRRTHLLGTSASVFFTYLNFGTYTSSVIFKCETTILSWKKQWSLDVILKTENVTNAVQNIAVVACSQLQQRGIVCSKGCRPLMYRLTQVLCLLFLQRLNIATDTN